MKYSTQEMRSLIDQEKGAQAKLLVDIENTQEIVSDSKKSLLINEESHIFLQSCAKETQKQLQYYISEAGTIALGTVFDDPYKISVEFVEKRNSTECQIRFERNGEKFIPMDESGLGAADIAGFGLRISLWSLPNNRTRGVIILDEPFKHLKGKEANRDAIKIVKRISEKFNLQIIMVSDERADREDIMSGADRVFEITEENGKSKSTVFNNPNSI